MLRTDPMMDWDASIVASTIIPVDNAKIEIHEKVGHTMFYTAALRKKQPKLIVPTDFELGVCVPLWLGRVYVMFHPYINVT